MRTFWTSLLLVSTVAAATEAYAVPPARTRGLDLPAIVSICDYARRTEVSLRGGETLRFKALKTIVIDPGHGGENQGALGVANVHEKFLTMELAYELRDQLQRRYPEARIVMTRYWDTSVGLTERIEFANALNADLFVSLHYNAATHDRALGFETYFLSTNETIPGQEEVKGAPIAAARLEVTGLEKDTAIPAAKASAQDLLQRIQADLARQAQHEDSALLARITNEKLAGRLEAVNRGVKQANFAVLRGAQMPAIVVESGFVTHPKEGRAVARPAHRTKIVHALMDAIESFDAQMDQRHDTK